ncbi:hypothetical protein MMC31_004502 [Peltigera leucophlebia]|nr:hypothetical protein [Peltigera leucophlebia]
MELIYTIQIPNGHILSFEPHQDDFVLLEHDNSFDSAHQRSSKFVSSILEITSAWERHKFFRNFVIKVKTVETKIKFPFGHLRPNRLPPLIINPRHLAVLAHCLGLKWQEFDPRAGNYLARGNSQFLTSFKTPGHGVPCVEYTVSPFDPPPNFSHLNNPNLTLSTSAAIHFLFGYIPPFLPLSLPGYEIGSIEAVYETANQLDPTGYTSRKIKDIRFFMPNDTLGFSDIIPFTAPWLRVPGCEISQLASPTEYTGGLTRNQEGFRVFLLNLEKCLSQKNVENTNKYKWRRWVLKQYKGINSSFPASWECEQPSDSINAKKRLEFLDHCQGVWEDCTKYLVNHNQTVTIQSGASPGFTYLDLVSAQIKHSISYWGDAWARIKAKENCDPSGCWIKEGAHLYWDYLPKVAQTLREKITDQKIDEHDVREVWSVMMLRAFCWWRCHYVDQVRVGDMQTRVIDPRYIGSETEVAVF